MYCVLCNICGCLDAVGCVRKQKVEWRATQLNARSPTRKNTRLDVVRSGGSVVTDLGEIFV